MDYPTMLKTMGAGNPKWEDYEVGPHDWTFTHEIPSSAMYEIPDPQEVTAGVYIEYVDQDRVDNTPPFLVRNHASACKLCSRC